MEISVIVGGALVILCIVALCYISSNSYVSPPKEEEIKPKDPEPEFPVGTFRILPRLNKNSLEPFFAVERYVKNPYTDSIYYTWTSWWDKTVKTYQSFSTETEAQLFIDSYLETERILKQKELQYQEFMKNNPPKIYPKVIDEQDTGAIPRDYS